MLGEFLLLAALVADAPERGGVVAEMVTGKPELATIDVIAFGADGVLLIGDGRGARVVAVATGDVKKKNGDHAKITDLKGKLAAALGASPGDVELIDMAVNPASSVAYFAVRKQDEPRKPIVLTVAPDGAINELSLDKVRHASMTLPTKDDAKIGKVTDLAWAGSKIVVAAQSSEEFSSRIYILPTPIRHEAKAASYSAETYHISHRKWETKAPMSVLLPFQENGKSYLLGAFSCTPVVKYPLDALEDGAKVKGMSVLELGSGNRPVDMFSYVAKDGESYILANTFRFHHQRRPYGPSPYWTAKIPYKVIAENEKVNENALRREAKESADRGIKMVEAYHGVMQMDLLGDGKALVLRSHEDGRFDLETLDLP